MESKPTAVQWLRANLRSLFVDDSGHYQKLFAQAIEMEKQQIKDAWVNAWQESFIEPLDYQFYEPEAEQYYNETYGM
jgi:hypothetical protein